MALPIPLPTLHTIVGFLLLNTLVVVGLIFWTATHNINLVKTTIAHTLIAAAAAGVLVQWRWRAQQEVRPANGFQNGLKRKRGRGSERERLVLEWPLGGWLAAFFGFLVLSTLLSPFKYASVEELARFGFYVAVFVIAANWARSLADVRWLLRWLLIVATLAGLYGLAQQVGLDFIEWQNLDRIIGPLGNPNFFAGFLILVLPICTVEVLLTRGWSRAWRVGSLLVMAAATLLTFARAAWLGGTVGLLVLVVGLLIFHRRDLLQPALPLVVGLLAAGLGLAAWFTFPAATSGAQRVQLAQVTGATFRVRLVAWEAGWRMFLDAPLLGQGLGTYQQFFPVFKGPEAYRTRIGDNTQHAHSEWLEALGETGLVGTALYIAVFLAFAVHSLRAANRLRQTGKLRQHAMLWGLCAGVIAGLAHGSLEVTLRWTEAPTVLWCFMGLAAALWRGLPDTLSPVERGASAWHVPLRKPAWIAAAVCGGVMLLIQGRLLHSDYALKQGQLWRDAGYSEVGISYYEAALRTNPWNLEALYQLGSTWATEGDPQRALQAYLRLKQLAPDYASIDTNLALVLLDVGRDEDARQALERALAKDQTPRNRMLLADRLFAEGRVAEGMAVLTQIATTDSDHRDLYAVAGGLLSEAGSPEEELAFVERGLARFPDDLELRRAAVSGSETLGDATRLLAHLRELVDRDPLDRRAALRLGDLLEEEGRWAEAQRLYQDKANLHGLDSELGFRLAQAAHRCGDWETARPLLESLSRSASPEVYAMAAQRYLAEIEVASVATTGPAVPQSLLDEGGAQMPENPSVNLPVPEIPRPPRPEVDVFSGAGETGGAPQIAPTVDTPTPFAP